ncbi:amidase [Roseospira marina]|uniref:Amidase n=1 Tax=Roseospira marina TaxID=140057 RepID=A0A5M6IG02_9PROT|nr:amidase family protein [Roseospira marina]KAA5607072.1 amidase [Roseospira marina]MBB4312736.1 amidase [Roseospira marina]MBB5086491.1 amidase [Roseospira marina]
MTLDLIRRPARDVVRCLRRGEVSPLELIDAALDRHTAVDGTVNAVPTLCADRARTAAARLMDDPAGLDVTAPGWLAGLPVFIKDLTDVAGVRSTHGSPIFAQHRPDRSDLVVETLERRGAVVLGKTNTPEFGAGANTFNPVFGATLNPHDTRLTCGGSSGGAAVALATGMAWLATGSDLGGSLRVPAAFCGVVGLRPSPGRVARGPVPDPWCPMTVEGPMARDVADCALLLDAQCGATAADPFALEAPAHPFLAAAERPQAPLRVGWSPDLGLWPVDPEIAAICERAVRRFETAGTTVDAACPDFTGADTVFHVLRAASFVANLGPLLDQHRDRMKSDVVWNIAKGMAQTTADVADAWRARAALTARVAAFFETFDLLACPTTVVPPFPVTQRYVESANGQRFDNYLDWLGITYTLTLTGCPVLSIPCGTTTAGLPVGLQLMARPRGEAALLSYAALLEGLLGHCLAPIEPRIGI